MQNLTFRQRLFIEFYLGEANGNSVKAARLAGYRWPEKQGPQQLGKTSICEAIQGRVSDVAMSADAILARLSDIAAGDLGEFITVTEEGGFSFDMKKAKRRGKLHLLKKLKNKKETRWEKTGRTSEGGREEKEPVVTEQLEIELHDPQNALHKLGQYHGLFKEKDDLASSRQSDQKPRIALPDVDTRHQARIGDDSPQEGDRDGGNP